MVRTVCAPFVLCALASPARSYVTRCSLLPPRSGEACKARHATWGCVQSQAATAKALLEPRPLANACLCEALGRQARGSSDFCAVLLKNNTAGLATVDRAGKRQQPQPDVSRRSWTWSIRCRSCSTFRAPNSHRRGTAGGQEAHTRGILPFGKRPLRLAQTPSPGTTGAKIRQKCGTIPFRFNSQMRESEMQPADLISEPLLAAFARRGGEHKVTHGGEAAAADAIRGCHPVRKGCR